MFMRIINETVEDNKDNFGKLGLQLRDLGYHSTWKKNATMFDDGCKISPTMSIIYIRAGCYMGSVKNMHLHYDKSEDQYVGI